MWTRPRGPAGELTADAEVMFELTATALGGRQTYVASGYRPQYRVLSDYQTSTTHHFIGVDRIFPGECAKAEVWFITPEVYPHCLWVERRIEVAEGSRVIGYATVLKVLNPLLQKL